MRRNPIAAGVLLSLACTACIYTGNNDAPLDSSASAVLIYSTGGYVPIVTTIKFYYMRSTVIVDSGYCRGGRRQLDQVSMSQLQAAVRQLERAAGSTPQSSVVEAPSLQLLVDGRVVSLPDTSARIPEEAQRALDQIDEFLKRLFGRRCTLDKGRQWNVYESSTRPANEVVSELEIRQTEPTKLG